MLVWWASNTRPYVTTSYIVRTYLLYIYIIQISQFRSRMCSYELNTHDIVTRAIHIFFLKKSALLSLYEQDTNRWFGDIPGNTIPGYKFGTTGYPIAVMSFNSGESNSTASLTQKNLRVDDVTPSRQWTGGTVDVTRLWRTTSVANGVRWGSLSRRYRWKLKMSCIS